jgi:tetratricopeptide (TPR) repeat protein
LCRALSVSHDKGIVHCDIKPSNILLGEDGLPILFDFNIAFRKLAASSPGNVGGTVPYMAPEQIRAFGGTNTEDVGPASDLFSLGATIYELLTGIAPFGEIQSSLHGIERMLALRQEPPVSIRRLNPSVHSAFAEVIHSCMAYSSEDRPASANDLAERLEQLKKKRLTSNGNARRSALVAAGTVAALALAAGAFISTGPEGLNRPDNAQGAVVNQLQEEDRPPEPLTALQIHESMKTGYAQLKASAYAESLQTFLRVLDANPAHAGAAIGAMRASIQLPQRPQQSAALSVSDMFNPKSVPELIALQGTVDAGVLSFDWPKGEQRLKDALRSLESNTVVLNNLAYCYMGQGKRNQARDILDQILADNEAPDTSRLLMAWVRANDLLFDTSGHRIPDDPGPLIEEYNFSELFSACERSGLHSIVQAIVNHACANAYSKFATQHDLNTEQNAMWISHSEHVLVHYADAIEQGVAPQSWRFLHRGIHAAVADSDNYREWTANYAKRTDGYDAALDYRRMFVQDPLTGTRYEEWLDAHVVPPAVANHPHEFDHAVAVNDH